MFDISITPEGIANIKDGDIEPVTYEKYVAQKIYNAIMIMPLNTIVGFYIDKKEEIKQSLQQYLNSHFAYDNYIDPNDITITINESSISDHLSVSLKYSSTSPVGIAVEYDSELEYNVKDGSRHVNYEPDWLSISSSDTERDITIPINITEVTQRIELPMEPMGGALEESSPVNYAANPIYLLTSDQLDDYTTEVDGVFTVPIYDTKLKYNITSYITGYVKGEYVIDTIEVVSSSLTEEYYITIENGDVILVVDNYDVGEITGTVTMFKAVQVTRDYEIRNAKVYEPIFPLRRSRGKYFAVFSKTINIGEYYIKYKAITEVI